MNWLQTVRMAFKSILNNKVRSILTMLGIIIGVASVIDVYKRQAFVYDIGGGRFHGARHQKHPADRRHVYPWENVADPRGKGGAPFYAAADAVCRGGE